MGSNVKSAELRAVVSYLLFSKMEFFPKQKSRQALHKIVSAYLPNTKSKLLAKYWDSRHWCWLAAAHFPLLSPPNYLSALPTGGTQNKPNDPTYPNIQRQKIQIFKCSNIHIFNYDAETESTLAETYSYCHRQGCLPA